MKVILGLAVLCLPIWRDPSWTGGVNAYEAIYNVATKTKEHLTVEEALEECRQAYSQVQQSLLHST